MRNPQLNPFLFSLWLWASAIDDNAATCQGTHTAFYVLLCKIVQQMGWYCLFYNAKCSMKLLSKRQARQQAFCIHFVFNMRRLAF